jgi:AcrR family transcriptional regulator
MEVEMKKSEKTKLKILNSAIKIFYKNGYDGTTTKEIAVLSQISEGTIFKYFNSKKELLTKCIDKFIYDFTNEIIFNPLEKIIEDKKDAPFEEILKFIIYDRTSLLDKYYKQITIFLIEAKTHPEIKDILLIEIIPKFDEFSKKLIEIGINKGEIKENTNNIVTIRSLVSSVFFMFINHKFINVISSGLTIEEEIDYLIEMFLYGIKRR